MGIEKKYEEVEFFPLCIGSPTHSRFDHHQAIPVADVSYWLHSSSGCLDLGRSTCNQTRSFQTCRRTVRKERKITLTFTFPIFLRFPRLLSAGEIAFMRKDLRYIVSFLWWPPVLSFTLRPMDSSSRYLEQEVLIGRNLPHWLLA